MNRMLNAAKLDFYTAKSTLAFALLTFVVSAVVGVSTRQPVITMVLVMVFGVYICGSVFSVAEKNHTDKLYGILPLTKHDMITGRYIYALIIGLADILIAGVFGFEISLIVGADLSPLTLFTTLGLAFVYFCFAVGIAFPIYYKFTFTKAYVFTMIPIYIVMMFAIFLSRRTGFYDSLGRAFQSLSGAPAVILLIGLVVGLILLAGSIYVSDSIYKRKEIY